MEAGDKQTELLANWENLSARDRQDIFFKIIGLPTDNYLNRRRQAAMNQQLAEDFYLVISRERKGLNGSEFEVIKAFARESVEKIDKDKDKDKEKNRKARNFLNAAMAQAGVMDLLERAGFSLGRTNLYLDLQGLDVVAVDTNVAYLIDAKAVAKGEGIIEVKPKELGQNTIGSGLTIAINTMPETYRKKAQIDFACLQVMVGVFSPVGYLLEPFSDEDKNILAKRLARVPQKTRQLR